MNNGLLNSRSIKVKFLNLVSISWRFPAMTLKSLLKNCFWQLIYLLKILNLKLLKAKAKSQRNTLTLSIKNQRNLKRFKPTKILLFMFNSPLNSQMKITNLHLLKSLFVWDTLLYQVLPILLMLNMMKFQTNILPLLILVILLQSYLMLALMKLNWLLLINVSLNKLFVTLLLLKLLLKLPVMIKILLMMLIILSLNPLSTLLMMK